MREGVSGRIKLCGCLRRYHSSCSWRRDCVMAAFKGVWTQDFWRAVCGEFVAMLIFVLLGLGSTINWGANQDSPPPPDLVLISLCFGLSIATLVQCFGHISGAHINPAVTTAMVATRKLSLAKGIFYLGAQSLGAIVGAAILYGVTPPAVRGSLGVTSVNAGISAGHALVIELLITFELVFTVFATCDPKRSDLKGSSSLAIGLSVCIGHLFAVYWVGPLIGAVLAAALYEYLFCPDPEMKRRYKSVLSKNSLPRGQYEGMEPAAYPSEQAHLVVKQPAFTVLDVERAERKEREAAGEVLSSV
ncbi:aquaporin-4 isoform X2 [Hoplias malabaricus]|uniref:aquaporin-4 isoform X2 n=1 Tax=Hoplias malabaricus TaxID=27720 RepID=UPI0034626E94